MIDIEIYTRFNDRGEDQVAIASNTISVVGGWSQTIASKLHFSLFMLLPHRIPTRWFDKVVLFTPFSSNAAAQPRAI